MNVLEIYINEVERQLDRKVKIVRLDSSGKYYGKCDKNGQHTSLFGNYIFTMACS